MTIRLSKLAEIFGLNLGTVRTDRARGTLPITGREGGKNPEYGPTDLVAFALWQRLYAGGFDRQSAAREVVASDAAQQILSHLARSGLAGVYAVFSRETEPHSQIAGQTVESTRAELITGPELPVYFARHADRAETFTVVALDPLWRSLVAKTYAADVALTADVALPIKDLENEENNGDEQHE